MDAPPALGRVYRMVRVATRRQAPEIARNRLLGRVGRHTAFSRAWNGVPLYRLEDLDPIRDPGPGHARIGSQDFVYLEEIEPATEEDLVMQQCLDELTA